MRFDTQLNQPVHKLTEWQPCSCRSLWEKAGGGHTGYCIGFENKKLIFSEDHIRAAVTFAG